MNLIRWVLVLVLLLAGAACARAAEVRGHITYVGAAAAYVDVGRSQGVAVGDRAQITRGDSAVTEIAVTFVADNSASCALDASMPALHVGDEVIVVTTAAPAAPAPAEPVPQTQTSAQRPKAKARPAGRVFGRIGAQLDWQSDNGPLRFDYVQPSLAVRLGAENVLNSRHTLSIRLRSRRTIRDREQGSDPRSAWTGRVYEIALTYDPPESRLRYVAGRVLSNRLRGIGTLDGLAVEYSVNRLWSVGVLAGAVPDPRTTEVNTGNTQAGIFAALKRANVGVARFDAALALAGQYHRGEVSREFIYEQLALAVSDRWRMMQSGEVNINRGWRQDGGAAALELANLLWNVSWTPRRNLGVGASWDTRVAYRTWETRDTPDSLFDDSRRQGLRTNASWRPVRMFGMRASAGRLSTASGGDPATTLGAGLSAYDIPLRGSTVDLAVNTFDNAFAQGRQPSLTVSQQIVPAVWASAQAGQTVYDYRGQAGEVKNNWLRLQSNVNVTRGLYGAASFETFRGDSPQLTRFSVETGVRL